MAWLVIITMTASYQKIFDANPRIGFLTYAKVWRANCCWQNSRRKSCRNAAPHFQSASRRGGYRRARRHDPGSDF